MHLLIVGNGRMGRAIAALAEQRGHTVHACIGSEANEGAQALAAERLEGVDVALEFTTPHAAAQNVRRLIEAGIATVSGTTGWEAELAEVKDLVVARRGALLYSTNFSVGVHLFLRAARELGRQLAGRVEFGAFILEEHHAAKRDAPSGTALLLKDRLGEVDRGRDFPITSVRAGTTPGTHIVAYDGPFERITLEPRRPESRRLRGRGARRRGMAPRSLRSLQHRGHAVRRIR